MTGRFGRVRRELEEQPAPLPLPAGPVSNGEFVPASARPEDTAIDRLVREVAGEAAGRRRLGRRALLAGAGAVAASLAAFELAARARAGATALGGHYELPVDLERPSTLDPEACAVALHGDELVVDVHTHYATPNGPWVRDAPETVDLVLSMVPAGCANSNRLDCVDESAYLHDVFLASDTTLAVLTDVPNSGPATAPVPFPQAVRTEQLVASLGRGGAGRLLVENVIAPNVGPLRATLEEMSAAAATKRLSAFKVYTAWSPSGRGFSLEDPAIGLPVLQHAHDLGIKVFVAHKGLPLVQFDPAHNHPGDMVAVSRQFRDMQFLIYHAAWDPSHVEGPYDPAATVGVDTLLAALDRYHVPANDNVWVDIASMWRQLITAPGQAAHALGKLLRRVGERRVLWGTDSVWFGSPQPQIMAMRAFTISAELQDRYGYPALTPALKARLFGLNAAELFGLDVHALRCGLATDPVATARPHAAALEADAALPSPWTPRGPLTRREVLTWLARSRRPWTPS